MRMRIRTFIAHLIAVVLLLLDRLAGRWLDWRMDRAIAATLDWSGPTTQGRMAGRPLADRGLLAGGGAVG